MGSPAKLFLKIDAIDVKKWVKFVAMQQNIATLNYDFYTIKGKVESCLKRIEQNTTVPGLKNRTEF